MAWFRKLLFQESTANLPNAAVTWYVLSRAGVAVGIDCIGGGGGNVGSVNKYEMQWSLSPKYIEKTFRSVVTFVV